MKSFRLDSLRMARRLKQFNLSLLATLAALALTACDTDMPEPPIASTSLSQGVQQMLHAEVIRTAAADGARIALATPK